MKAMDSDWYRKIWSLDIKEQSWVENTENEVDFIIEKLALTGKERILDLACGFGRHSLAFAKRGYDMTGVDITQAFIDDANKTAAEFSLPCRFICSDIREVSFENEFDVVLNLADGAIGYLENDAENLKIFDVISKALKSGGKHFMDICNADHAERYFPAQYWDAGSEALSVSLFEWDSEKRIMLFGDNTLPYGEPLKKPQIEYAAPQRLYSADEINEIWKTRGMKTIASYSDYKGREAAAKYLQLMMYSQKV